MARLIVALGATLLLFATISAQTSNPVPPQELRKWDVWIGDWVLSGTAKDSPGGPNYKVDWSLHERWTLGGFFCASRSNLGSQGPGASFARFPLPML